MTARVLKDATDAISTGLGACLARPGFPACRGMGVFVWVNPPPICTGCIPQTLPARPLHPPTPPLPSPPSLLRHSPLLPHSPLFPPSIPLSPRMLSLSRLICGLIF